MTKIALQNLGCSKNQVDGERILNLFKGSGYEITEEFNDAEIIVVNTCAFIREAQEEAIESILEMGSHRKGGRCQKLIVSGCFSERYREKVKKEFPEVDLWVGVNDWENLLTNQLSLKGEHSPYKRNLTEPIATQYLKIAEGCSHGCTFCVIPAIRGTFKSRGPESVTDEAQWLESQGVKEIILVAQDTSFYGRDIGTTLPSLLKNIIDKTSIPWIRMMYLYPKFVTDELLELIASQKRILPYFDIPLQHISDDILKAMNRTPLSKDLYKLIHRIRATVPGAGIRSSFIMGFPGEKETHFKELAKFIEFARFDKVGVFPYSPEDGTSAVDLKGRPRSTTVTKRCEELMLIQREISREILEAKVGTNQEVIIERVAEDPDFNFEARSRIDAPEIDGKVLISTGSFVPGDIVNVKIIGADDYDLYA